MSAVGQGTSGGEGAAAATQSQGQDQGQQGPDLSQLAETLGQQGQTLEEMRTFLQGNPWQQQQADQGQQADPNELDLSWLDEQIGIDPAAASARLNEVINGAIDQRTHAALAPIAKQQQEMRFKQESRDLVDKFPELEDMEAAKKLAGPGGLVEQALQQAHPDVAARLGAEPWFWGLVHMANRAAEIANQEGSGDPGAASLESGSGAGPGPTAEDLKKAIMNSGDGLGASVLNF